MTIDRRSMLVAVGCWALALMAPSSVAHADGTELAIVMAEDSSVTGLTFHELKQLYMGQRLKTPKGEWMVPLNRRNEDPERVGFDDSVLGMNPEIVRQYWIDRKIRGQSGPPKTINSGAMVLKLVNKVPGAIGYVRASEASGVRVLKIDGKRPGEPGYGIHM